MRFLKITKVPKHNRFDYKPRYYDAKKEDLLRRVKLAEGRGDGDVEAAKERIVSSLRRSRGSNPRLRKQVVFKSNMLLLAIIVVLMVGLFVMINVYLPQFVK